jgi:hypothetical protein
MDVNPLAGSEAAKAMNQYNQLNTEKAEDRAELQESKFTLEKKAKTEDFKDKVTKTEHREVIEEKVAKKEDKPRNPFGIV